MLTVVAGHSSLGYLLLLYIIGFLITVIGHFTAAKKKGVEFCLAMNDF